ncbi:odorant receptor 22b-like [Sitophilus oryzae]|uniref:Odorant receptor 22b-like n=1 Tax=Sitophilus oryzae TaxID=7048 RepID=A0A6J2Y1H7_SITOR|nr:odorant receptor 22b-like [Sitophilus oryzae]
MKNIIRHAEESIDSQKKNLSPEDCEKLKNNYIYKDICLCVDRYNLVKEFVNDIEDTFSIPLFWQFGASVFVICLGYLQFFFVELWSFNFFTIVSFVVTMSWEVFLYCYFGSILYNESASLITDIYVTDWLNLDIKCQKALVTIMENGKRPLIIRAGKIIDISLDTFATILKRAYSVMAVVNKFIEN